MPLDPITGIAQVANTILSRVLPDKEAQAAAQAELARMQLSGELAQVSAQIDVDRTEAASSSVFVSGWRPFIGWICGAGLGYQFLMQPLLTFAVRMFHGTWEAPHLETESLINLLLGMLGLASMRTVEKIKGVVSSH
jgi:hypothetical protein